MNNTHTTTTTTMINTTTTATTTMINTEPFAVFVVAPLAGGLAATTRPEGGIGLPGGKLEPGETALQAVVRESAEEGWDLIGVAPDPIWKDTVDGKTVWWLQADSARMRAEWKEKGRITPVVATREQVAQSGHGNGFLATVRDDIPAILDAVRDASRYSSDHFDRNYRQFVDLALAPTLLAHKWVGVACLPLASVQQIVTKRESVSNAEFGIGSGTTGSGRTVYAMIPTQTAYCVGWERDEDTSVENQANIAHNRSVWPTDTWVVVATDKDPRRSAFTTDRGEFGAVEWKTFAPLVDPDLY